MANQPISRAALEEESRNLIGYLEHVFGRGRVGMTLFVFELGGQGINVAYISTARRDDMIAAVKEWLARQEAGLATDPPGPRAAG